MYRLSGRAIQTGGQYALFSGEEEVTINLGLGSDTFTLFGTHAGLTTINGLGGNDFIAIESISGPTVVNAGGGDDPATTVFVKDARYEKMMEAFGGVGVYATTPQAIRQGIEEAFKSRRPTLINAIIDETAGTESGRITALNPTAAKKSS